MVETAPQGCDPRVWQQLIMGLHDTEESVSLDGHTFPHKTQYDTRGLQCELCHDWGVIYDDIRFGRMDRVHTVHPHAATHIVILSIGSRKFPNLACDECNRAGLGAVAVKWRLDGSVPLSRYRMMREWNQTYACAYSEC